MHSLRTLLSFLILFYIVFSGGEGKIEGDGNINKTLHTVLFHQIFGYPFQHYSYWLGNFKSYYIG